jgi:hypothetical protein
LSLNFYAQDFSDNWDSHFSYLSVTDISQSENKVFVASENVVFTYDVNTFEIEKITTVEKLSGEIISTIHYSEAYEMLMIGYENGLIDLYQDGEVTTVVDIIDKQNIPPNNKRINQFNEYDNVVYIATDYGISVYDLERLEFGDTYFIGNGGSQIAVKQTEVFNDYIYAACTSGNGMRRAEVNSNNLIDFQNWNQVFSGSFGGVQKVTNKLYALGLNQVVYEIQNNNTLANLATYSSTPESFKSYADRIVVTEQNKVHVYSEDFTSIATLNDFEDFQTRYSSAIVLGNYAFIGTKNNINQGKSGFGILKVNLLDNEDIEAIHPKGPLLNRVVSASVSNGEVWLSFGGFSQFYNFNGGVRKTGLSHLKNEDWINVPYDTIRGELHPESPFFLSDVAINPFNPGQVFVASYWSGLIELNDDEVTQIYNEDNSTIEELAGIFNLTLYSKFDSEGTLWAVTGRVERPLNSFRNGQWQSYDFSDAISSPTSNLGFAGIETLLNQNTVFVGSLNNGVIGYNLATNEVKAIYDDVLHNLPSSSIYSLALDRSNQLWIGTNQGLRVLYNTSNFFTDSNVSAQAIIFLEDGIPQELLEQQFISDIKVDGSNNKWIGTIGAGAYYFSSDGQETIYRFTKDNSPLPSNNISDIALDDQNGIVYIATDKGMVSFSAGGSKPQETLENAYAYPNPVRPNFNMLDEKIKIKDISENCNIKITDIEGNLVAEAQSNTNLRFRGYNLEVDGGTAYWNGKNMANNSVATGVYLVMLTDLDTQETNVLKLMIVR